MLVEGTRWENGKTYEDVIGKIESKNFAFLEDELSMKSYLIENGKKCNIVKMGENVLNGNVIIAWKKDFLYGNLFNHL